MTPDDSRFDPLWDIAKLCVAPGIERDDVRVTGLRDVLIRTYEAGERRGSGESKTEED